MIAELNPPRPMNPELGSALAFRNLTFEQLSLSYLVDAKDFFEARMSSWTWQDLQFLTLTSPLLKSKESRPQIYPLLSNAGISALHMPRLHTMVLWNDRRGNACVFIYQTNTSSTHITWRSTWELELTTEVVKVWRHVAFKLHSDGLVINKQRILDISSHGDAIHRRVCPVKWFLLRSCGRYGAKNSRLCRQLTRSNSSRLLGHRHREYDCDRHDRWDEHNVDESAKCQGIISIRHFKQIAKIIKT